MKIEAVILLSDWTLERMKDFHGRLGRRVRVELQRRAKLACARAMLAAADAERAVHPPVIVPSR